MNLKLLLVVLFFSVGQCLAAGPGHCDKPYESISSINPFAQTTEIKIDSSYFVKNDGIIEIYFSLSSPLRPGEESAPESLQVLMYGRDGKTDLCNSNSSVKNSVYGSSRVYKYHFTAPEEQQPLAFIVDPGKKTSFRYALFFFDGFITDFRYDEIRNYRIAQKSLKIYSPHPVIPMPEDMTFSDESTAWIISGGDLLKSTNQGRSWNKILLLDSQGQRLADPDSLPDIRLNKIFFLDRNNGWIAAYLDRTPGIMHAGGTPYPKGSGRYGLFSTRDGGESWQWYPMDFKDPLSVSGPLPAQIENLFFSDQNHGWFYYTNSYRLDWESSDSWIFGRTNDGGKSWSYQSGSRSSNFDVDYYNHDATSKSPGDPSFVTPQKGWIIFHFSNKAGLDSTVISRTIDGGENWIDVKSSGIPKSARPFKIHFQDEKNGLLLCTSKNDNAYFGHISIFSSGDGGNNWEEINTPFLKDSLRDYRMSGYSFTKDNSLTTLFQSPNAKGYPTFILSTDDSGRNWLFNRLPGIHPFSRMCFLNRNVGLLADGAAVYRTTDGGRSWELTNGFIDEDLISVSASDNLNAVAIGKSGLIIETNDGENWKIHPQSSQTRLNEVICTKDKNYWIAGDNGTLLFREGTEGEFKKVDLKTKENILKVKFLNEDLGYVVADSSLYKTLNGGRDWVKITSFGLNYSIMLTDVCIMDENRISILWHPKEGRFSGWLYLLNSTDQGLTWQTAWFDKLVIVPLYGANDFPSLNPHGFTDFRINKSGFGYAIAGGIFYQISNNARNWKEPNIQTRGGTEFSDILTISGYKVLLLSANGVLCASNDFINWAAIKFPGLYNLPVAMSFYNENEGWIVGRHGLISKIKLDWDEINIANRIPGF